MSVRGVEFAAGPPSHAGTTRTTPDSGLGGDERGGPRVPPPGFQNINQQPMYAGHTIPGGAPENGNYVPAEAGDFKRFTSRSSYSENENNGQLPGNFYSRMAMNRAMTSAAMQMQQQQFHSEEQQQQYVHSQIPGMPPTGPGIYGGPPIHMGSNGSAMMALPPGMAHPGMPHHPQQPVLVWDGPQYHQFFLPAAQQQNGPNQQRPNSTVTSSMSTATAVSSSYENEQPQGQPMQMTPQQQQMLSQQPPPHFQQVTGVPPHMYPPQSPQQQQFLPNGHPHQPPMFMPPGQMYHIPPGYGGFMPPPVQNQFLMHPNGAPMMMRQPDGTVAPMLPHMQMMVRPNPPQQMPPSDHFGRPPMMFMQQPHDMMERGPMMPGMYMSPQQPHTPQGPPAYGTPPFSSLRNGRGGFNAGRGGRYSGRGGRGRNMHTPSSVHSEPRSESVRSDAISNMEDVTEKVGDICLGASSPSSPENQVPEKPRRAPSKQMLQLAAAVKTPEEKPCDPTPTVVAPVTDRLKPAEKEESPSDPVVSDKKDKAKETADKKKECSFCKSTKQDYKGHVLSEGGRVTCQNAMKNMVCSYCGNRGGVNAHTMLSCPQKKLRDAQVSRDVTPRESVSNVRESSVDSRASITSGRQQGRGGYHHGGHRGGSNDYKNFRGRKPSYNRGGRGGGNNASFQDLPPQRQ